MNKYHNNIQNVPYRTAKTMQVKDDFGLNQGEYVLLRVIQDQKRVCMHDHQHKLLDLFDIL